MPTQTFFNLPEDKRDKIIEAAIGEFAAGYFDSVSVASIVRKADIPRGSFYQYFDDLKDLYKYLFEVIANRKVGYMQDVLEGHSDALKTIRELFVAGLEFAADHPAMAAMGTNFFREDPGLRQEIMGEYGDISRGILHEILAEGQRRGEINAEVDVQMAALALQTLSIAITDQHIESIDDDDADPFADGEGYMGQIESMLFILERGLMNPEYRRADAKPVEDKEEGRDV